MNPQIWLLALLVPSVVNAISDSFTFELSTKEKGLKNLKIIETDEDIFIGQSNDDSRVLNGTIQDDGSLKLGNNSFIGISKNLFTVTNDTTEYAQPFSIDKKGKLNLYGSKKFKAIPSGGTGSNKWTLGSSQATSNLKEGVYEVEIKCVNSKGKSADKFSISGSGASGHLDPISGLIAAGIVIGIL